MIDTVSRVQRKNIPWNSKLKLSNFAYLCRASLFILSCLSVLYIFIFIAFIKNRFIHSLIHILVSCLSPSRYPLNLFIHSLIHIVVGSLSRTHALTFHCTSLFLICFLSVSSLLAHLCRASLFIILSCLSVISIFIVFILNRFIHSLIHILVICLSLSR